MGRYRHADPRQDDPGCRAGADHSPPYPGRFYGADLASCRGVFATDGSRGRAADSPAFWQHHRLLCAALSVESVRQRLHLLRLLHEQPPQAQDLECRGDRARVSGHQGARFRQRAAGDRRARAQGGARLFSAGVAHHPPPLQHGGDGGAAPLAGRICRAEEPRPRRRHGLSGDLPRPHLRPPPPARQQAGHRMAPCHAGSARPCRYRQNRLGGAHRSLLGLARRQLFCRRASELARAPPLAEPLFALLPAPAPLHRWAGACRGHVGSPAGPAYLRLAPLLAHAGLVALHPRVSHLSQWRGAPWHHPDVGRVAHPAGWLCRGGCGGAGAVRHPRRPPGGGSGRRRAAGGVAAGV